MAQPLVQEIAQALVVRLYPLEIQLRRAEREPIGQIQPEDWYQIQVAQLVQVEVHQVPHLEATQTVRGHRQVQQDLKF